MRRTPRASAGKETPDAILLARRGLVSETPIRRESRNELATVDAVIMGLTRRSTEVGILCENLRTVATILKMPLAVGPRPALFSALPRRRDDRSSSRAMGVDDWFGRERGLGEAEAANLVYAADFDANEIELLELPDDLLQRAREGEELVFKGGPDEEAVLCTSDATYLLKRVETSNTLLLMRGASGAIDDRREDEAEADETDEADATQTPSAATVKRRRVSETSNAGARSRP